MICLPLPLDSQSLCVLPSVPCFSRARVVFSFVLNVRGKLAAVVEYADRSCFATRLREIISVVARLHVVVVVVVVVCTCAVCSCMRICVRAYVCACIVVVTRTYYAR